MLVYREERISQERRFRREQDFLTSPTLDPVSTLTIWKPQEYFFFKKKKKIYLFLAASGLRCSMQDLSLLCAGFSSSVTVLTAPQYVES